MTNSEVDVRNRFGYEHVITLVGSGELLDRLAMRPVLTASLSRRCLGALRHLDFVIPFVIGYFVIRHLELTVLSREAFTPHATLF